MAKKVVATLRSKDKANSVTKVYRAVKNEKSGSYSFREDIIPAETVPDFLANAKKK